MLLATVASLIRKKSIKKEEGNKNKQQLQVVLIKFYAVTKF